MIKIIIHSILIFAFAFCATAQTVQDIESLFLDIPPLKEIIDTSFLKSPLLKTQTKAIEIVEEEVKVERKSWMNHIYIEGATNYGVYDNLIVNSLSNDIDINTGTLSRNEHVRLVI